MLTARLGMLNGLGNLGQNRRQKQGHEWSVDRKPRAARVRNCLRGNTGSNSGKGQQSSMEREREPTESEKQPAESRRS